MTLSLRLWGASWCWIVIAYTRKGCILQNRKKRGDDRTGERKTKGYFFRQGPSVPVGWFWWREHWEHAQERHPDDYSAPYHRTKCIQGHGLIRSCLWHDQLYTVTIWTQNYSNYEALRSAAFERFGDGSRRNESIERYIWSDKLTDRMLEYVKEGEHGMLWMWSRDLDRKLKLSKYDASISYIKWLRSRELEREQTSVSSSFLQEDSDPADQESNVEKNHPKRQ